MYKIKPSKFTEICGWYGMAALIGAYLLVSTGLVTGQSLIYQLLNLTAGMGLLIVTASKGVTQAVITNLFWIAIALVALGNVFLW